ncbi:hypothetical protein FOZ62_024138 [Perkinsus olseni]|uniref:Uncharacterized protein n=1 Tax=Perkinsus olseni TaxID=32597 RepID=A0A7J6R094_PEROL|nr:hypothetical protein FOZ62_024138 [Perkinsus olseni]
MSSPEASPSKKRRLNEIEFPYRVSLQEAQTDEPDSSVKWDLQPVASYSWDRSSTAKEPHIAIPGQAPVYRPVTTFFQVYKDTGEGSRKIEWDLGNPMESAFHALAICDPDFDWSTVDLVTDRNNLRKLLKLVDPVQSKPFFPGAEEGFKILADVPAGNRPVVFTAHREGSERIPRGVGIPFEEHMTVVPNGARTFEEYHRVVLMNIGSLRILVRTEVDAMTTIPEPESLSDEWVLCKGSEKMRYQKFGKFNADDTVVELKSKSAFFPDFQWRSTFYQMLLGKVDKLVLGWHKRGLFKPPTEYKISQVQIKVEDDVDKRLRQLGALLQRLMDVFKQEKVPKALELNWSGGRADLIVQPREVSDGTGTSETCRFVESFIESTEVLDRIERGLEVDLDAQAYLVKLPPWLAQRVRSSAPGTEIGRSDPINGTGKEKCRFAATGCALQGKPSDFEIRATGSTPDGLYLFGFGDDNERGEFEDLDADEADIKGGSDVAVRKVIGNRHIMPMRMDAKYKALLKERLAASNNVDLKHRTEVDTRSADELLASQQVKMFQYAAFQGEVDDNNSDDGYSFNEGPSAKRVRVGEAPGTRRTLGLGASALPLPDVLMRLLVAEDGGWTLQQMAKRLREEGLTVNLTQLRRNLADLCDYQRRAGDNQPKYYLKAEYKQGGV